MAKDKKTVKEVLSTILESTSSMEEIIMATIAALKPTISANFASLKNARLATLATWDVILPMYDEIVRKFNLKKDSTWTELFQPIFEAEFPGKGWSYPTLKYYRGVCGDTVKREAYVNRGFDGSEESVKTVSSLKTNFQKLNDAIAKVNKVSAKVKDFAVNVIEGQVILIPVTKI